jgi:hypothetical protein
MTVRAATNAFGRTDRRTLRPAYLPGPGIDELSAIVR